MNKTALTSGNKALVTAVPEPVAEVLHRIESCLGVMGCVVGNADNALLHATVESALAEHALPGLRDLCRVARHTARDVDASDDLRYVRVCTRRYEMMVAPDPEFLVVVFQAPVKSL